MSIVAHPARKTSLTADEREVIVTYNDADRLWRVFSESRTMRGTILRLARRLGATVRSVGGSLEFEAPADALKLASKRRGRGKPFPKSSDPSAGRY